MVDLIQPVPVEVLTEMLGYASVPDILRFMQVNRRFRDIILETPFIQHRIDLYSTGFEYNTAASLAESRKALSQYRSNLYSLCPSEKRTVEMWYGCPVTLTGGVCAIVGDSVRLFTLGSTSRGIPSKEWKIMPRIDDVNDCCFCPSADVISFLKVHEMHGFQLEIQLATLSEGGDHPDARFPTIYYSRRGATLYNFISASISSSRLVVLAEVQFRKNPLLWSSPERNLIIWDWNTGQILFDLRGMHYETAEFIDNYRLFVGLRSTLLARPSLALMDTRKDVGGSPTPTIFHFSPWFNHFADLSLILERDAHTPSHEGSPAPFNQDPSQRIIALKIDNCSHYLVVLLEPLLELARDREGLEIEWDEWESHLVIPSLSFGLDRAWVSGCRLFCAHEETNHTEVTVYDFSVKGHAKSLSKHVGGTLSPELKAAFPSGIRCLMPIEGKVQIEGCDPYDFQGVDRDNFVFTDERGSSDDVELLHIWAFS